MNTMSKFFINILPGLLSGILAGIVLLVIEYRTHWFANRRNIISETRYKKSILNFFDPRFTALDAGELMVKIMTFLGIFLIIFLAIGLPLSEFLNTTNTSLDMSNAPNIIVSTINDNDTKSFFNNSLFISVIDVGWNDVSFSVGSPGFQTQSFENFQIGSATIYFSNNSFDIRVTSIRRRSFFPSSVDFTVTKLQTP